MPASAAASTSAASPGGLGSRGRDGGLGLIAGRHDGLTHCIGLRHGQVDLNNMPSQIDLDDGVWLHRLNGTRDGVDAVGTGHVGDTVSKHCKAPSGLTSLTLNLSLRARSSA
jgi:hypothetical protein